MAIPQRQSRPGTHVVARVTWNRRRVFQTTTYAELFLAILQHYRCEGH